MTVGELLDILRHAEQDLPVCWTGPGGAPAVEITAAAPVDRVTYLPVDGLVARGPAVLLGEVIWPRPDRG